MNNQLYAKEILNNMKKLISNDEAISCQGVTYFTHDMYSFEADMFLQLLDSPKFYLRTSDDNGIALTKVGEYGILKSDYIVNKYNYNFILPSLEDILKVISVLERMELETN